MKGHLQLSPSGENIIPGKGLETDIDGAVNKLSTGNLKLRDGEIIPAFKNPTVMILNKEERKIILSLFSKKAITLHPISGCPYLPIKGSTGKYEAEVDEEREEALKCSLLITCIWVYVCFLPEYHLALLRGHVIQFDMTTVTLRQKQAFFDKISKLWILERVYSPALLEQKLDQMWVFGT